MGDPSEDDTLPNEVDNLGRCSVALKFKIIGFKKIRCDEIPPARRNIWATNILFENF